MHIHQSLPLPEETQTSVVSMAMLRGQLMLIETPVAECRLDHSGSFVRGVASV